MNLDTELKKLGLSEKETKVYLALLELGEAAVQKISQKSKVNRATTYVILEGLVKKGLVSVLEKENKTLFGAQDPELLSNVLRAQEREVKEKETEFKKLLPELKALYNLSPQKPKVRFFEGKDGLKSIQEDFLKEKNTEIDEFYSSDDVHNIFSPAELEEFRKRRVGQKIKSRAFYTRAAGPFVTKDISPLSELKYMRQDQYPLNVDILIYNNKIALISLKEPLMGVIVENKDLASALRSIFKMLWDKS